MGRTKQSQSKHDRAVQRAADSYSRQGFDVTADIKGYQQPKTIGGYRPDVVAKRGRERIIVEVETPDSVDSARDQNQQKAFRRAAQRSKYTSYKRTVTR